MNKVKFWDLRIIKNFWKFVSAFGVIISIVLVFIDFSPIFKFKGAIATILCMIFTYAILWIKANRMQKTSLSFDETTVEVYFGDIFKSDTDSLKTISFNEYFDTEVGGKNMLVSENTINGKYLNHLTESEKIEVEEILNTDERLQDNDVILKKDVQRKSGKTTKYRLGTIVELPKGYLAVSGSKFDKQNKANITMREYISFLLNFWNEVDRIYNGRSVVIPVFGSGILRFTDGYSKATQQDLLEIILWTFKVSRIKITYPSKIEIVIFSDKKTKYNLYKLKEITKNGL